MSFERSMGSAFCATGCWMVWDSLTLREIELLPLVRENEVGEGDRREYPSCRNIAGVEELEVVAVAVEIRL